ncbi:hypothetical protein [Prevotella aurantiaca]|jgi:hypothetical protein|uniref:hypothetical protein n=1 Tax=Prevotella aurantiaca TaxID=596085 RepID=UPI0023EF979F|nr:hypothetical protein [Prevotella aurantiaca]
MKSNEMKKAYAEPQTLVYALYGESQILAGSPPPKFEPSIVEPDEETEDLVGE